MMKIGYLDDEYVLLKSAIRSLKKYDIEVVALDNIDDVANITMLTDTIISDSLGNRSIVRTLSSLHFCATIVLTTNQSV